VKISFVLYMLLIQYLQFVDGDLCSNGRIVQFYLILVCIFTVVGADCVIAKCHCVFLLVQKIIK